MFVICDVLLFIIDNSILYHHCAEFPYMNNFGSLLVSNLDTKTFNLVRKTCNGY